jgi:hypothetical protein
MGVAIDYTYAQWIAAYPQFTSTVTSDAFANTVYPLAQQYCRNDGGGPVSSSQIQTVLLGLMCSHIAQLLFGVNGQGPSGIVGRVTDATEGSVSVSADFPATPANAWFLQTQFGASFWQATAAYRVMRYIPGPRRAFNPFFNQ